MICSPVLGGHRALEDVGGACVGFSEIAGDAINAYCVNYNISAKRNFGDITRLRGLPQHDFMTAGVPCQSWSIAGKNLGFDDDRGQLWNDTLFLLAEARSKVFIFENVKGLADPRNKVALSYILSRIRQAGYRAQPFVLMLAKAVVSTGVFDEADWDGKLSGTANVPSLFEDYDE